MGRLKVTLLGLVMLLAVVGYGSGCGGSGDDTTFSAAINGFEPVLEKAEFVEGGDAICRRLPRDYEELARPLEQKSEAEGKGKPSAAEVGREAVVPSLTVAVEEFRELPVPEGEERRTEEIVEALEAAKKGVEEKPASKLAGPESPFDDFQNLTRAYGFELCNRI